MAKKGSDKEKSSTQDNEQNMDDEKKLPEKIKDSAQWVIAIGIILLLLFKLIYRGWLALAGVTGWSRLSPDLYPIMILSLPTLELVGKALAYSAGVDLAYMLTTPGPDEAIEPLILGLASAILFSISKIGEPNPTLALEIGLYVLVLGVLFLMKEFFIKTENGKISIFWEKLGIMRKNK